MQSPKGFADCGVGAVAGGAWNWGCSSTRAWDFGTSSPGAGAIQFPGMWDVLGLTGGGTFRDKEHFETPGLSPYAAIPILHVSSHITRT